MIKEFNKNNNLEKNFWFLIGNKSDLQSQRKVQIDEGKEFAKKYGMKFFETSAKNGENVGHAFEKRIKEILSKYFSIEKNDENKQKNEKKSNSNKKDEKSNCNLF